MHVEVYLGDNKTIGARFRKGTVCIHEHYSFVSTSYYNIRITFKSIETWLDGICRSFCSIHPWGDIRTVKDFKLKKKKK